MRSIILAIALLFTTSIKAQDTTYIRRGYNTYMRVTTLVSNGSMYKEPLTPRQIKHQRRVDRIFSIGAGVLVVALSYWYFKIF